MRNNQNGLKHRVHMALSRNQKQSSYQGISPVRQLDARNLECIAHGSKLRLTAQAVLELNPFDDTLLASPQVLPVSYEGCDVVEFHTPHAACAPHVALRLPPASDVYLMACRIILKLELSNGSSAIVTPKLAQRNRSNDALHALEMSAAGIIVDNNVWYEVTGLFTVAASNAQYSIDPLLELPTGCKVSIGAIDTQRFSVLSAPDLSINQVEHALATVSPFSAVRLPQHQLPQKLQPHFCFAHDLDLSAGILSGWLLSEPVASDYNLMIGEQQCRIDGKAPVELAKDVIVACGVRYDAREAVETSGARDLVLTSVGGEEIPILQLPIPLEQRRFQFEARLSPSLLVKGQARDMQNPERAFRVALFDSMGTCLSETTTCPFSQGKYEISLPAAVLDGICRTVSLRLVDMPNVVPINLTFSASATGIGIVEKLTSEQLSGWAVSADSPGEKVDISVQWEGAVGAQGVTGIFRPDLTRIVHGNGFHGFDIRFRPPLQPQNLCDLKAYILGAETPLGYAPNIPFPPGELHSLERAPSQLSKDVLPHLRYDGKLESIHPNGVNGWALDKIDHNNSVVVDLFVNGVLIESTRADGWREDIQNQYGGHGRFGFYIPFPPGVDVTIQSTIAVRFSKTNLNVKESPQLWHAPVIGKSHNTITTCDPFPLKPFAPPIIKKSEPNVAIVVLNLDGADHLGALFRSFSAYNTYHKYRFIVVDHGSTDASFEVCQAWSDRLNIDVKRREMNFSFSASNNYGAEVSEEEILFFLNNDILIDSCILSPLVRCFDDPEIGIVGLKLVSPVQTDDTTIEAGFVQHLGVKFGLRADRPLISPYELPHVDTVDAIADAPWNVPAVTGAALAIRRSDFEIVGGFDERYFYGYEDIDFCLAYTRKLNKRIVCANHIQAYHNRGSTRTRQSRKTRRLYAKNHELLSGRFGALVRQEARRDMVRGGRFWRMNALRIAFAVSTTDFSAPEADYFTAFELGSALRERLGWEVTYLAPEHWYDLASFDVVVAMRQDWSPYKIKSRNPNLMCVAWPRNWFDRWLELEWLKHFDLIWSASEKACSAFESRVSVPVVLMRIASNVSRFSAPLTGRSASQYSSDYCFTGSFFHVPRDILSVLDPTQLPYNFALYGHNWDEISWLEAYWRGAVPYDQLPEVYASTKIVIDDANFTVKYWGSTNSRVYDALAAGALVFTNGKVGAQEVFAGKLPTYDSQDELHGLLQHFLENPEERMTLVAELQAIVCKQHSYAVRAQTAARSIGALFSDLRCRIEEIPSTSCSNMSRKFGTIFQKCLRKKMSWVRLYDPGTPFSDIELLGDDVVFHVSTQPFPQQFELRTDQIHVRLHLGAVDDLSLTDVRRYDAVVVSDVTAVARLEEAKRPILPLFDTPEMQAACYEIMPQSGEIRYRDARVMQRALTRLLPTLIAQVRELNRTKYDYQVQQVPDARPEPQSARLIRLLYWPETSDQHLMYAQLPESLSAQPGSLDKAIEMLSNTADPVVFHLHWAAPFLAEAHGRLQAESRLQTFLDKLDEFQQLGGKFVCTVNPISSDDVFFHDLEVRLCQEIAKRADLVHIHGEQSAQLMSANLQIPSSKLRIIPQPDHGAAACKISRLEARQQLGILRDTKLFLYYTPLCNFEGRREVLEAFAALRRADPSAELVIAGQASSRDGAGGLDITQEVDGVLLAGISGHDMLIYMRAADVLVLPYLDIFTAGLVDLAYASGLQIITPQSSFLLDTFRYENHTITYDAESEAGLKDALQHAAQVRLKERATTIKDLPSTYSWHYAQWHIGRDIVAVCEGKPRTVTVAGQTRSCMIRMPKQSCSERVAAVVLHYGHIDDTIRCVNALLQQTYHDFHIYIVSNDEDAVAFDMLARYFPQCTVIQSPENLGYAGGNNIALSLAKDQGSDLLWVVNPDTVAPVEYLSNMVAIVDLNSDVSVFGSQILYGDKPDTVWFAGGRVSWDNGLESKHIYIGRPTQKVSDDPIPSDYVTGASLFFRTELLDSVGFIPEDYFLYFEETHWCQKAASLGHKIVTFPQATLYHHKRSEEDGAPTPTYLYYYVRNAFLMCAYFQPSKILQTEARLRALTRMWLDSVARNAPDRLVASQQAVARGFEDGLKGVSGKMPISHYTEVS